MKGLENAIRNLNSLDTRMVPQASAWAITGGCGLQPCVDFLRGLSPRN